MRFTDLRRFGSISRRAAQIRRAARIAPGTRRLLLEPLEDRRLLSLQPLTAVADTIWPNWVVEGEEVGLRVTVANPRFPLRCW
jgi:hypothetical protein